MPFEEQNSALAEAEKYASSGTVVLEEIYDSTARVLISTVIYPVPGGQFKTVYGSIPDWPKE